MKYLGKSLIILGFLFTGTCTGLYVKDAVEKHYEEKHAVVDVSDHSRPNKRSMVFSQIDYSAEFTLGIDATHSNNFFVKFSLYNNTNQHGICEVPVGYNGGMTFVHIASEPHSWSNWVLFKTLEAPRYNQTDVVDATRAKMRCYVKDAEMKTKV